MKALVQLGRFGDIANVLPLLEENNRHGKRAALCCSQQFASILDGVSYCDKLVYEGAPEELDLGVAFAHRQGYEPVVSQVYGDGVDHRRISESYARDEWEKVGKGKRWEQLALQFDRRDPAREDELAGQFDWSKPVVLLSLKGTSSPFANTASVQTLKDLCPEFAFLDISDVRAHRIYDLLGLMDRAHALVTIDTATMHLAKASSVPVVALVNPNPWYGTPRTANQLLHRTYKEVDPAEIASALRRTLKKRTRIFHVWTDYPMGPEDLLRHQQARESWLQEYRRGPWNEIKVKESEMPRLSSVVGDPRPVGLVNDLLRKGLGEATRADDIVVMSNTDVGFTPGLTESLVRNTLSMGAAFGYRHNFDLVGPLLKGPAGCSAGYWDGGLDLFAFSGRWLRENLPSLPEMYLGRPHWDLVFRDRIKQTGGGQLYGACWHLKHKSFWTQNLSNPACEHNLAVARAFYQTMDSTRPYRHEWS